jgi:phenylacetate-CoA ligase
MLQESIFPINFRDPNNIKTKPLYWSIKQYEGLLTNKNSVFWQKAGERKALKIFHEASIKVPAYKDFLKKHKVNPVKIKTISDFSQVPPTDKANYIQEYSLAQRSVNGNLDNAKIIASSSGTSGTPNYWPRGTYQDYEAAVTHELLFKNLFNTDKRRTLCIIGFPMGVYVSGIATLLPSWAQGLSYPFSIVSAGNNRAEVLKAIKNLGDNFEQILLIGHPFFLKDVLETGKKQGISWGSKKLGLMFCSEGFSEAWREYVLKAHGIKTGLAFNTYGSSEMLLMAYETHISISVRKLLEKNKKNSIQILGSEVVPNLFQYNPILRFIEEVNNELLFTSFSGTPLVRFNLHDTGKILSFNDTITKLSNHLENSAKKNAWQLPFVTVAGRSDHTIIFYAANIYPQHIHYALNHQRLLKTLTGKFTMTKGYHSNMDEYLEIHIELKSGMKVRKNLARAIEKNVIEKLKKVNAEYNFLWHNLHKDLRPKIKLWPYGHEKYFKVGLKPKYIA